MNEEAIWISRLREGDEKVFEKIFHTYYKALCIFAEQLLPDKKASEEVADMVNPFEHLLEQQLREAVDEGIGHLPEHSEVSHQDRPRRVAEASVALPATHFDTLLH